MHERSSPPRLSTALFAVPLLVVIAGATALSRAQAPDPPPPEAEAEGGQVEGEARAADPAAPDAAAAGQTPGPLEDYEASEQISEDLSVSFPVDI